MNYIEQIKGFWIAQEAHQLGTSEIALYFHLLEICNKTGWTGTFNRNNYKVMSDLSIRSYKTFQSVRDKLSSAGIIVFVQKNGDANCRYELNDLGKKYLGIGQGKGKGLVEGSGKGKGEGSGKVNINQTQTKPNQTSKSHSGGDPPAKKKNDVGEKNLYWKLFVKTFQDFYLTNTGEPYSYTQKDFGCLDKIYHFLKKRAEVKNYEWNEETIKNGFNFFLKTAYEKDNWTRQNFSIPNLLSQFNQIANGKNSTESKQPTGAGVSSASIFEKIAAMPG